MCWKEEWAYAIKNLSQAIVHIERARKKMEDRRIRAQRWLEKWSKSGHAGPKGIAEIQEIIGKRVKAAKECDTAIRLLKVEQANLRALIETYGFSKKPGGSVRVRKILEETFGKEAP